MFEDYQDYPPISEQLIQRLIEDFPDKIPREEQSLFNYGFRAGVQSVIDKLIFEYQQQQKEEES